MTPKDKLKLYEIYICKLSQFKLLKEQEGIDELINNGDRLLHAQRLQNDFDDDETKRYAEWAQRTLINTPNADRKIRRQQRALNKSN
jgi:hypothetical protein